MAQVSVKSEKPVAVGTPAPRTASPWEAWDTLRDQMDRMFGSFSAGFPSLPSLRRTFGFEPAFRFDTSFGLAAPAVDVAETDKEFQITAELPGIDEKNLDVSVSGGVLTIRGEKREEKEEKDKNKNYYLSERRYGSFQRSFQLPDGVDQEKIGANFDKGVLRVTLPKSAEAVTQQKKIPIASR
ncbi:MAG TPA: Hsp20/alpha crystallin family protein [Stellaceae bacterium]|nr:Hsp20/alpha crystallin family protein [Stellaceae bacterium]